VSNVAAVFGQQQGWSARTKQCSSGHSGSRATQAKQAVFFGTQWTSRRFPRHSALRRAVSGRSQAGENLEGERSPRENRAEIRRQRRSAATDWTMEQSLEAGCHSGRAQNNCLQELCARNDWWNSEGATVAVTRCGYRTGEIFGGYEQRHREKWSATQVSARELESRATGNVADLMAGYRVQ